VNKHPIQPLYLSEDGVMYFKQNKIITYLFESGKLDLNEIAVMDFSNEDQQQIAQLVGYSLSGYGDLSYVDDDAYAVAQRMSEEVKDERDVRIAALEETLENIRSGLREAASAAFRIHPDDLNP
jgi:hypothetical protein